MGCGASKDETAAYNGHSSGGHVEKSYQQDMMTSTGIDKDLDKAKAQEDLKVKLLLLGAGESGKSTIFKQMRILHGSPPTEDDQKMYGVIVRSNIITALKKLCGLLKSSNMESQLSSEPKADNDNGTGMTPKQAYDVIMAHIVEGDEAQDIEMPATAEQDWVGYSARAKPGPNHDAKLFLKYWREIKTLWESRTMKEVWNMRAAVNVIDGHKDYLQDIVRIASPQFRPTQQDILLARVKTTQVIMERYRIDDIDFEMFDVGGQRSERRKWIDYFDNVDAVIFVAALSEFDQSLAEAKRTNRMSEALELFRSVCNNRAFANTSIMLFLNKKDIFAEKIMYSDIAAQKPFADYAGPPKDFNSGVMYFIQKFKECLIDDDFNDSFIHVTCATDTNNMEFVLDSTRTIIMTDNLRRSGFLGSG